MIGKASYILKRIALIDVEIDISRLTSRRVYEDRSWHREMRCSQALRLTRIVTKEIGSSHMKGISPIEAGIVKESASRRGNRKLQRL